MSIKPKTYKEIFDDMVGVLLRDIEEDMFLSPAPKHAKGLRRILRKLKIKNANDITTESSVGSLLDGYFGKNGI